MKKILYHGSDHIITNPEYGHASYANDYGRGFYCTENIELAKEFFKSHERFPNCICSHPYPEKPWNNVSLMTPAPVLSYPFR